MRVAVTGVLAVLSHRVIEMPIRRRGLAVLSPRVRVGIRRAVVAGFAAAVAAALAVSTIGAVSTPSVAALTHAQQVSHARPDPAKTRVLMLGDSQLLTLMFYGSAALLRSGPQCESYGIVGCGLLDPGMQPGGDCDDRASRWRASVRAFDPDLSVLLVGAWEALDFSVAGHTYVHGTPEHARELARLAARSIRPLLARGGHVALLQVPSFGDPLHDTGGEQRSDPASVASVNDALRTVARRHPGRVTFVPWADAIAPGGHFEATVDGVPVRPDGVHFVSIAATRLATDRLVPILRRLAVEAHAVRPPRSRLTQ